MKRAGTILRGQEFEPVAGRLVVDTETGRIDRIEAERVESSAIIIPAFVNAHTHLGDSMAKEAGAGLTLEELVAPPDGLKHRLLRAASREDVIDAMERSLSFMQASGTAAALDFREGGIEGVDLLRTATRGSDLDVLALARESIVAMEAGDGFGASGANDDTFDHERGATREAGKPFAIHAGEVDTSDILPAIELEPDFLVHMVHAEADHLERVANDEIPVVVCPRSNLATGVGTPPIAALHERTAVALGTDNVMLNSPSMFREMEFAAKLSGLPAEAILRMATVNGADLAGLEYGVLEAGRPARFIVIDGASDNLSGAQDPARAVVRRAGVSDVLEVCFADR